MSVGRTLDSEFPLGISDGTLRLNGSSTLILGTAAAPAILTIGWNESTALNVSDENFSSATGVMKIVVPRPAKSTFKTSS